VFELLEVEEEEVGEELVESVVVLVVVVFCEGPEVSDVEVIGG